MATQFLVFAFYWKEAKQEPKMMTFPKFLSATALSAALMFAQPPQGMGPGMMRGGGPGGPSVENRVDRLAQFLSLTDAQKTQATTIFTNAATAAKAAAANLSTTHDALSAAVKKNDTVAIDQAAAAIGQIQGQILGIESKANAAFYAILTPDQQAKYDTRPGFGPGGPGPNRMMRPRE